MLPKPDFAAVESDDRPRDRDRLVLEGNEASLSAPSEFGSPQARLSQAGVLVRSYCIISCGGASLSIIKQYSEQQAVRPEPGLLSPPAKRKRSGSSASDEPVGIDTPGVFGIGLLWPCGAASLAQNER
jgi:hypothetical protein